MVQQESSKGQAPKAAERRENQGKILVIDDNESVLIAVREFLQTHNYQVTTVSNPMKSIESLKFERPDLIICDIMMPGVDGRDLHAAIKQNPEWCTIPFVFLTALSSKPDIQKGKALGCDDYLTKPFELDEMLAVIKGKLTLAHARTNGSKVRLDSFRKQVLNSLSHEFKTPLVAVCTGSELLREKITDTQDQQNPENMQQLLDSIQHGAQRLQRLVSDFISLQQIESGAAAVSFSKMRSRIAVESLIEQAIEFTQPNMRTGRVVNFERGPKPHFIHVYSVQMIEALRQLLSNADKFSPLEHPIQIALARNGDKVKMSIHDHGPGMTKEELAYAQEMFTQIDREKREQQGAGLGLAIASYYVDLNQGSIQFERKAANADGQTEFEVTLEFALLPEC
ncbi:response regulator [bacterium]|nr:response regulator [bacterium]